MLKAHPSANATVLVVWEPVLATDWGAPSPSLTSMVADSRALHFWDRDRKLSALLGGREKLGSLAQVENVGFRMKDVIWDAVLVYPPGAVWGSPAGLLGAPVVDFGEEMGKALGR